MSIDTQVCFIAGYGSLMSAESRRRTGDSGETYAAVFSGARRALNIHFKDNAGITALGIVQSQRGDVFSGVVVATKVDYLSDWDRREHGYRRREIERSRVTALENGTIPDGPIYAYTLEDPEDPPTEDYPNAQSYLDVVVTGCLEDYGPKFARLFVVTTTGWDGPWINDRNSDKPRYIRFMPEVPLAPQIDSIFEQELPQQYANRKVELVLPEPVSE